MEKNNYSSIAQIKEEIEELYSKQKSIVFSCHAKKKKKVFSELSKISAVYDDFFTVETNVNGYKETVTICYRDIYIGVTTIVVK